MDSVLGSVVVTSMVVAAFAFLIKWAMMLLNWAWLRPRKLEKYLREQGLNGSRYSPFLRDVRDCVGAMRAEQPRSLQLSDDILPHIYPYDVQKLSEYGENCFVWFGPWPLWIVSDPEIVMDIMKRSDAVGRPYGGAAKILTSGIVTLEGHKWAKHRKIANPAFHLHNLKNMVEAISMSCCSMISKLEQEVCGSDDEIDVWPHLEDLSGDMISRALFGTSHEKGRRIFELQKAKVKLLPQVAQFAFIPKWRYIPVKVNRQTTAIIDEIKSIVKGIIEERQKATTEMAGDDDLLSLLLQSTEDKINGMSDEDVINECEQFYFVGSETTASLLVWTMLLLCQHPQWQSRAREEVNRVVGINTNIPSFQSLNQLKTVTMILQEVLRLYPVIPVIVRRTTEAVRLGKWNIPAGVYLKVLIGLLHHDPKIWGDDAKEFNPERFAGGVKNQFSYIPFAAGPHVCIGQSFAMMEAKIAMAMLLRRFSFQLSPSYSHAPFSFITMSPQYGAPMILHTLPPT